MLISAQHTAGRAQLMNTIFNNNDRMPDNGKPAKWTKCRHGSHYLVIGR